LNIEKFMVAFEIKTERELVKHFPKEKTRKEKDFISKPCAILKKETYMERRVVFFYKYKCGENEMGCKLARNE